MNTRTIFGGAVLAVALGGCGPAAGTDAAAPPADTGGGGGGGCADGRDDDGDGRVDLLDPGCADAADADETDDCPDGPGCPACSNRTDDDGDGLSDWGLGGAGGDPGCTAAGDDDETDVPECQNGADDDGDALVDYPADPGCDDADDTVELQQACKNGVDDDGDGLADFPADPDCDDPLDADEQAPAVCANGADDDGDAYADFPADPGCDDGDDGDEFNPAPCLGVTVENLSDDGVATGTTAAGASLFGSACGGDLAPEGIAWMAVPAQVTTLQINTLGSDFQTVLYVLPACDPLAAELGCAAGSPGAYLTLHDVPPGEYWVFADGAAATDVGDWRLSFFGIVAPGQACVPGDLVFRCDLAGGFTCAEAAPGTGFVCTAGSCSNALDDDADAITDWPLDPGCDAPDDADETDPPFVPACYDGMDNDGDALADFGADPGCEDTADDLEVDECVAGLVVGSLPAVGNVSDSVAGTSFFTPSCSASSGPEDAWFFTVPSLMDLTVSTANPGTSANTTLEVRSPACGLAADSVGCSATTGTGETVFVADAAPGDYYAIVDTTSTSSGAYELSVSGAIALSAECDPVWAPRFVCTVGTICDADPASTTGYACRATQCTNAADDDGDALADYPAEPGCADVTDDDETDPPVAPQCANGADDDADLLVDWPMDTGCVAASDDDETCTVFGTDAYGYTGCEETPPTIPCADISTTGTVISLTDDSLSSVPIGFSFDFYGTAYTSVNVGSNGKMFATSTSFSNVCLPSTGQGPMIAPWWDDLYPPGGGTVRYATTGTPGSQELEVQWQIEHFAGTAGTIDVRVVLHEGTNEIVVCYVDTTFGTADDNGATATAGIQNGASDSLQYSCSSPVLLPGLVLRYLHP